MNHQKVENTYNHYLTSMIFSAEYSSLQTLLNLKNVKKLARYAESSWWTPCENHCQLSRQKSGLTCFFGFLTF